MCLERTVELDAVRLHLRDWPGFGGPIMHVPDPLWPGDEVARALAAALAPEYRVMSLRPRAEAGYQVDAADLLATLDQFGFASPVLVGERLGCLAALLVAAWQVGRVSRLVLIEPGYTPPDVPHLAARAVRDCPPDRARLQAAVACPVLVLEASASLAAAIEDFLGA